jgi:hypothetical protein
MSLSETRAALEPTSEYDRPFAAEKRKRPRPVAPPIVTHMEIPYRQWDGPKLPWAEDFGKGKGQVYSRDGSEPVRSCNEVEVAKRLRQVRDHAFWISCYSPSQIPSIWRPWAIAPEEAPAWVRSLDTQIRLKTGIPNGGIPDVVAWNDEDPVDSAIFVECKGRKESFKESQEDWVRGAVAQGIRLAQLVVAIRPFP